MNQNTRNIPVVAIDGPSGAGKSTVARGLAKSLGYRFIDTGALYRTIARLGDDNEVSWENGTQLAELAISRDFEFDSDGNLSLDGTPVGDTIRTSRMSKGASAVAAHPEVRAALLSIQRKLGESGGVVLEGRDIGTVVFPDAEIKFYLIAGVRERARRRHLELLEKGEKISVAQVEADQEARDKADMERPISPLKKASDAIEVNCDTMSAAEVITRMKTRVVANFPLTSI